MLRTAFALRQIGHGDEHGRDAALGVARAAPVNAAARELGREHRLITDAHGVHVRGEEDAVLDGTRRRQAHKHVCAFGKNLLEHNLHADTRGPGAKIFGHPLLAGQPMTGREKGGIDARQGDEI